MVLGYIDPIDRNGCFPKSEFLRASGRHSKFRNLVEESIKNIEKVDKIIENDLEEHFQTWIPMANNM